MTLAGLLPPLCDNGVLLMDGGYSTCFASLKIEWPFIWLFRRSGQPTSEFSLWED